MRSPMLVPDLSTATVTGNSGSSVYSGSTVTAGYTTTYTMGGTTLSPNVTVTTSIGPNVRTYTNAPAYSISAPTNQTGVDSVTVVSGTWTITPATLTATANSAFMTYGGAVPTLSGTVTGFVNGQTLASDSGTATWTTTATSASNAGPYGIAGNVTLGSPYSGDYTITTASGNSTALTVTAAPTTSGSSGSTGTGSTSGSSTSGSSGSGTQGGITGTNFTPVGQTVSLPGTIGSGMSLSRGQLTSGSTGSSSSGSDSTDNGSSTGNGGGTISGTGSTTGGSTTGQNGGNSSSGISLTLSSTLGATLTVLQPAGADTTGDGILSVQELKQ